MRARQIHELNDCLLDNLKYFREYLVSGRSWGAVRIRANDPGCVKTGSPWETIDLESLSSIVLLFSRLLRREILVEMSRQKLFMALLLSPSVTRFQR